MIKTNAAGSTIAVKISSTYTTIPGVDGIPAFGPSKAEYENTAINDLAKTYNADLPDPGDITLAGSWDSKEATHARLLAAAGTNGADEDMKVTYKSGATAQFLCKVMSFRTSANKGADEKFECRLKLTGVVTYVAAT